MPAHSPGLVVLGCSSALWLAACAPHSETAAQPAAAVAVAAAQRIVLDPAAGAVAVPPAEPTGMTAGEAAEVHLPDGTVGVRVAKRYYHTISVCRQADGSFSSDCPAKVDTP